MSPPKRLTSHPVSAKRTPKEFSIPFPVTPQTPSTSPNKSGLDLHTPRISQTPQTPSRQTGSGATTVPQTPTTSRRAALYERIRQKSLTSTPSSAERSNDLEYVTKDKLRILNQEELKRRCILGRLDEVAATVWAYVLFSLLSPACSCVVGYFLLPHRLHPHHSQWHASGALCKLRKSFVLWSHPPRFQFQLVSSIYFGY